MSGDSWSQVMAQPLCITALQRLEMGPCGSLQVPKLYRSYQVMTASLVNYVSNFWDSQFRAALLAITDGEPLINTKNCFHVGWISVLLPIAHLQNLFCNTGNVQRHCQVGKGVIHAEIITFHAGDTPSSHPHAHFMPRCGQMGSVKGFGTTTSTCHW